MYMHTKINKINKLFNMYIYIHDRVQRSNAAVYRVVEYKPTQRGVSCNMDRSKRAGIGQWHEYDHVVCNKRIIYWQSGTAFIKCM